MGARHRHAAVRLQPDQSEVTAVFDRPADQPGQAILAEAGIPAGEELKLSRVNVRDGCKTAFLNDLRAADRGVGGAAADAIGRRMATLAGMAQVLAVTHSPQVVARGGSHFRVAKSVEEGSTTSRVSALAPAERGARSRRRSRGRRFPKRRARQPRS